MLTAIALRATLGWLIGTGALAAMRSRRLHWTWAALVLVLVLAAREPLDGAFTTLAIASGWASWRGRRRHRDELAWGADLAVGARSRRTPADALAVLGRRARRLATGARTRGAPDDASLPLGRDERGAIVRVPFGPGSDAGRHALVLGATGSGKTITQAYLAEQAVAGGCGAIVVDPKGDPSLRQALAHAARRCGRELLEWSPTGPLVYNPYGRGSETEIADRALAGERFTEPHYLRQAQRYLGHAVRALRAGGARVSLAGIVEQLDPDRLELLSRTLDDGAAESVHAYLDSLTPRQRVDLAGVRDRLAILAESDVGRWLDPDATAGPCLDLLRAARARAVVYFSLVADTRPLVGEMLGAAIVQDLLAMVAALQERPIGTLVVIDEFSAIAAEQVVRLFARARSAGVSLVLGTQELSDLRPTGRERLLEQVLGNVSLLVAHRQVVPSSVETVAAVAGRMGAWRLTRRSDGHSSRTRVRELALDADRLLGLQPGWAAVVALDGSLAPTFARVNTPTIGPGADDRV